ncbi:MAG: sulfatase-like hydrolase/transferase [Opitutaceae bacterium]|nr:sulfatase-like hydrolase/transferase [Opitutaceae bacterium]
MPPSSSSPPNILFVMTDQQRFDTIAALGHAHVRTPNLDRLVRRGAALTNAYTTCPVCVPARYSIMTGCEPSKTSWLSNWAPGDRVSERCGPYLATTLAARGYRTWGLGKFHTEPRHEPLGFQTHEYSEELWPTESEFLGDDYVKWLRARAPAFAHLEQVHGERSDMYYVPQMRPMPADLTVEAWLTGRAIEEITRPDARPYFGFVSFVTPHPPIAPPIPYNRMFNPDDMPAPVLGDPAIDRADDYLAWMNHAVWAEDIPVPQARQLRARYFGSIAFIDDCIGRIIDAVEARPDGDNTLICFYSDHGDHMGDHRAWQKESFFEAACRVPFLVSWPGRIPANTRHAGLAALTDLFGLATSASGQPELRDGHDLLGMLGAAKPARETLIGMFGTPGTRQFKCMVRSGDWKYLGLANGGRELLFNLRDDPAESRDFAAAAPATLVALRAEAVRVLSAREFTRPAVEGAALKALPFEPFPRVRIKQFARGVTDFGQGPSAS